MHMADALVSAGVGGTLWAVSGGILGWCGRQIQRIKEDRLVPLMGVMGAFVFTAQMINFTIPGTGSSGHLGGGLLLAICLGAAPAFIVIASVLVVQALFFADGGLLALGCNIFNMGFWPIFIAYLFIYRPLANSQTGTWRATVAAVAAATVALQLGAMSVVVETTASGITSLPFATFALLMQPIHLAIGLVEGLATAAVVGFLAQTKPELLQPSWVRPAWRLGGRAWIGLALAALLVGGCGSWFASAHPDGLEWSNERVTGEAELSSPEGSLHGKLAQAQEKSAFLPDYALPADPQAHGAGSAEAWPAVSGETSLAGLVGGGLVLLSVLAIGFLLRLLAGWTLQRGQA